ncbi:MAG: DUF169 domain-containing protein [Dehalococcoidales bacterium]|nr:DUF169 domain-containing protein [Dehalococcoidales bacterium]
MTALQDYNRCGELLETTLKLVSSPIAVKMLEKEEDIPPEAIRPKKHGGYHLAQCQAFALSRREDATVAMLKEDNWCPGAVIAYGLAERQDNPGPGKNEAGDHFPYGKYTGILTAPLKTATFEPEVVIIYLDTNQLRRMLLAMKHEERKNVAGYFFPFSCAYAVVTPVVKGQYTIVLPDPGEYARALTAAGEMMFSIPANKLEGLVNDLAAYKSTGPGYAHETTMIMRPDFPQPDLYKKVFERWGMDHDK